MRTRVLAVLALAGGALVWAADSAAPPWVARIEAGASQATGCFVRPGEIATAAAALRGREVVRVTTSDGRMGLASVAVLDKAGLALLTVHASLSPPDLAPLGPQRPEPSLGVRLVRPQGGGAATGRAGAAGPDRGAVRFDMTAPLLDSDVGAPLVGDDGRLVGIVLSVEGRVAVAATVSSVGALLSMPRKPASAPTGGSTGRLPGAPSPARPPQPVSAGPDRPSDADAMRLEGERALDEALADLTDDVQTVAARQREYELSCVGQYVSVVGCGWWLASDACVIEKTQLPECIERLASIDHLREMVRSDLAEAEERARRAGVYPGVVRNLRARYGLERLPF